MKAQVVRGSKQQIAETVARISGEVHEAIIFVEESAAQSQDQSKEDIFAEMEPFMVKVGSVDYSRETLYTRMEGE
jgi:hypothetical protein